jgi:L-ascorbate metabolism protein UlaG (beta-lactamase superfamily)
MSKITKDKMTFMDNTPHLTYVGHATVLIEMDGVRLLTDPILRPRVAHLHHRHVSGEPGKYRDIDAILISHLHFDHLDLPSLKLLGQQTPMIVPKGAGHLLHRRGFKNIEEMSVGKTHYVKSLAITATYAHHAPERHPFGPKADCLGYLIQGGYQLYFAGDTDLFPEMAGLANKLDVALLPVWGWGPTLGKGHMDPLRAAQALNLLRPRLGVPIHWGSMHPFGMGWMKPSFLTLPPHDFIRHAATLTPEIATHIIQPGGMLSLRSALDRIN